MTGTKTTKYGYINIPYTFMARDKKYLKKGETPTFTSKLAVSKLLAISAVRSLCSPEREVFGFKKKKNHVKLTLSSFSSRYNVSASTSRRALASLEECEKIEKTEDGLYFEDSKMGTRYLHVSEWLFFATFGDQEEYLTKSEILVLSYFISFAKTKGIIKKSLRRIAGELGLSHTFVFNAVEKLQRLGVIQVFSSYHNRKNEKTVVYLENDYLREKKTETLRRLYPKDAEREEYYKNLRTIKEDRARAMLHKAGKLDPIFKENYKKWIQQQNDKRLKDFLIERLNALNMGWHDIVVRKCSKCGDTGTLPNGTPCGCYNERKKNK